MSFKQVNGIEVLYKLDKIFKQKNGPKPVSVEF